MKQSNKIEKNNKVTNTDNASVFSPFQNDHQSTQIGQLIFENQTNKVIVYGDIDLYKNEDGLAQAIQLKQIFDDIVTELENARSIDKESFSASNQSSVMLEKQSSKKVDNPFS